MDYMDEYEFGRPYMVGDEYILWKGKPEKGALFTGREIIMLPFALIWLAFSVFWELTAIFSGAPVGNTVCRDRYLSVNRKIFSYGVFEKKNFLYYHQ